MIELIITRAVYPNIKNTKGSFELDQLIKQQDYIWDKSATLQTNCIANQIAITDMNFYSLKDLIRLNEGRITYEYFKLETVQRFVKKYTALFNNDEWSNKAKHMEGHSLSGAMLDIYDWYIAEGSPEIEAVYVLMDLMFPKFRSVEDERLWIRMTLNSIKRKLDKLRSTVLTKYKVMGILPHTAYTIVREMGEERYDKLRELFASLTPKCYRKSAGCLNMWCIGLGMVLFSIPVKEDTRGIRDLGGWRDGLLTYSYNDSIFHYLTKYDITIVAHGDDLVYLDNDIIIQPTRNPFTPSVPSYKSASKLILALRESHPVKRINLLVCNSNKQRLYPQIYQDRNYLVNMHEGNVIIG